MKPASTSGNAAPALGGGPLAGAVVAEVVDVHAQHHRRAPRLRDRVRRPEEGVLAPVAAVSVVAGVGEVVELVGLDLHPAQPPASRELGARHPLARRQRGRHRGEGERALGAERVVRHPGKERGVGAAGEGHHDGSELVQAFTQQEEVASGHGRPVCRDGDVDGT